MGLVQCFVIVLMFSAQLVLTSPLADGTQYCPVGSRMCTKCPAGEFQKSCTECESCAAGSYTTELNCDDSCHPCYADCRPDFHLKVAQNCSSTSDLKCVCEEGFTCKTPVPYSTNCRYCAKIQETTTTEAAAGILSKDKHTPSSASPGHSSTSSKPCQFPKCGPPSVPLAGNGTHPTGEKTSSLAAILCPLVAMGCVALVILIFVCCPGDETCFKQTIAKLCNEGGREASHKPKESTHQSPRDSKQQPSCLSAANLGPVHVHNPGTVIFSLLSQFTGQVGPTIECGKTAERVISEEEEDERDCPVFHPTSSPSIHLSEEERSREIDCIFFPSQEQGKDCHVSKEEAL